MIDDTTWDESARPTLDESPDTSYPEVQLATVHHLVAVHDHLRSAEPAVAPVLDRLHAEHQTIHRLLDRVDRALVALVRDGDMAALDALEEGVEALRAGLLSHLAYEERELRGP